MMANEEREKMNYPMIEIVNGLTLIDGMPPEGPLNGTFVREEGEGVRSIMHFQNDRLHNENGPAMEMLGSDGKTMEAHYYRNGLLHRDGDLPAREYFYGSQDGKPTGEEYFRDGERHRDGGQPAVKEMNGDLAWYQNGKLHHEGGPSRITHTPDHPEGFSQYHIHGREVASPEISQLPLLETNNEGLRPLVNGVAVFRSELELNGGYRKADGFIEHYKNGELHADSGPALQHPDGTKIYYQEGLIHRGSDLPAVLYANGEKKYYRNGKQVPPPKMEMAPAGGKEQAGENRLEYKNGQYQINDRPVKDRNDINGRFIREGGDIEQLKNGKLHFEGEKPSVEKQDGTKMWHKDGDLQKVERPNGEKLHFENGKMVPEAGKENAGGKEAAGNSFSFGPQMKAGDLPTDSRNLHKDMVNALEGKRSPDMQKKLDGADMRQMQDTRRAVEHSQLMGRAEAFLKESGKTDGKVVHKDELTGKTVEYNLKNGQLHSSGKDPAFVVRDKHGQVERAEYFQNGNLTKSWDRETGQMFHHAPLKAQEKEMQKPQQEKDKSEKQPEKTPEKANTENKSLAKNNPQENKGAQTETKSQAKEETREERIARLKTERDEHQKQEKSHDRGERR